MMSFLIQHFIKNYNDIGNDSVREKYGKVTSITGILANVVLFAGKFLVGMMVNSVSIRADAINNLSDAGSSFISLVSFKLSSKPADKEHPYGHARYETIASMFVAVFIFVLGIELVQGSWQKILHPEPIVFSMISVLILGVSILVKLWMYSYNKKYAKILSSSILEATAADSISDVMASGAVLLSTLLSPVLQVPLDGYMGIIVSFFIMKTGYDIIKESLDVLLGKAPEKEFVQSLISFISAYEGVLGIHDLMIHNYGPQRTFASIHVEVDGNKDVFASHDMIDNIEREVQKAFNITLVIHMDPINTDDQLTNQLRKYISNIVSAIHSEMTIHDFRLVSGTTHTNLIFDVSIPYTVKLENQTVFDAIEKEVKKEHPEYYLVITFDRINM